MSSARRKSFLLLFLTPTALPSSTVPFYRTVAFPLPNYRHGAASCANVLLLTKGDSAIAYVSVVTTIIAVRYLNLLSWTLGLSWMVLAITVAAEISGKLVLNNGLASQFRPREYFTISRDTFEAMVSDAHGLINFFLIEAQRIVFVENIGVSVAVSRAHIFHFLHLGC